MSSQSLVLRELFGGAITIQLPNDLLDASELREVPDTQEVFVDKHSDISYILDVNERVPPTDNREAIKCARLPSLSSKPA